MYNLFGNERIEKLFSNEVDEMETLLVEEIRKITGDKEWKYECNESLNDICVRFCLGLKELDFDTYVSVDANNIHPDLDRGMLKWAIKETLYKLGYDYSTIAEFINSKHIARLVMSHDR